MSATATLTDTVVVRRATAFDAAAITRLAKLDSRPLPRGTLLVAELDDGPVAALSLDDGAVVADPFRPTADLVELLRLRASADAASHRDGRAPRAWRLLPRHA